MALVESSLLMAGSEKMLMDSSRYQFSNLSIRTESSEEYLPEQAPPRPSSVKRKRSCEKVLGPPRNRRRVFSYTTDPEMETYRGHVRAPADAVILFEACRLGLLPRVQRRLSEKERQSIKSGSVFVWDEREAGMRRWTDGKSWSASRVSGSFLTYREMEGKRGGGGNGYPSSTPTARSNGARTPDSGRGNESEVDGVAGDEGPDGYRYKPDGLIKQSFSITTSSGNHLHLISYYSRSHPASQQLATPSTDPSLRHIRPAKGMYPESTVHEHQNIPAVTRSPMATAGYQTVPQMANYARPSHWSPQMPQYGWSNQPGPSSRTPSSPQAGYSYQHGTQNSPESHPPPPPHSFPNGQLHAAHLTGATSANAQPPATMNGSFDERRHPPMSDSLGNGTSSYESRRQPLSENSGPPALQHPHESVYNQRNRDGQAPPPYENQNYAPRSGGPQDNRPSQAQYHPFQSPRPPHNNYTNPPNPQYYTNPSSSNSASGGSLTQSPSSHHQPGLPPNIQPNFPNSQAQYSTSPTASGQIDPRLTTGQQQAYAGDAAKGHGQSLSSITKSNMNSRNAQQATTVPSIGALMNGSSEHRYNGQASRFPNTQGPTSNGSNARMRGNPPSTSETLDRSSAINGGSVRKKDGPQDIPSDKVGFSEDMRALKVLDKGFR